MSEKSQNVCKTDFPRLSPNDLTIVIWPTLQIYRDTVLANVYTAAKFQQDLKKHNREIATSFFFNFCPCDLDLRTPNLYSSSTSHYLSTGKIRKRSDDKWQRNRRTQVAMKKKSKKRKNLWKKEKTLQQQKGLPTMSADINGLNARFGHLTFTNDAQIKQVMKTNELILWRQSISIIHLFGFTFNFREASKQWCGQMCSRVWLCSWVYCQF